MDAGNGAGGQAHGVCYPVGCDLYNGDMTGNIAATLNANSGASNHAGPSVLQPAAFMGGQGAKAGSIAYAEDGSTPTIKSAPSGGNTIPDVVYPINTMVGTRGGKDDGRTTFGIGEANDPQFTISAAHEHGVCYAIEGNVIDRDAKQNGMGVSQDVSPTLNEQDRHAVIAIEGNGARPSHMGTGCSESGVQFTLNTTEVHAVCFQQNQRDEVRDMGEKTGTVSAEAGAHQQNYLCYKEDGFAGYTEGVGTLKATGGDVGGVLKPLSASVFDARGNGDGETIPTLTGDHENRITDYTALCIERKRDE